LKLRDQITVRLSVRVFVAGTSTTLLVDDGMERKVNERESREGTTLISSWRELEHNTKIIQDSRQ
jgi:hypothetical protein